MKPAKLLILGGSGEAADLARALQGDTRYDVTLSLAGRTSEPAALPGKFRTGGFGAAEGLNKKEAEQAAAQIALDTLRAVQERRAEVAADATPPT